jgi:ATP-binding cassette subfamily B (MDR/TAP) protein 1
MASATDRFLYAGGIICSAGSGTILPLMTLIFGNFVTIFTRFAVGMVDPSEFKSRINHYT